MSRPGRLRPGPLRRPVPALPQAALRPPPPPRRPRRPRDRPQPPHHRSRRPQQDLRRQRDLRAARSGDL